MISIFLAGVVAACAVVNFIQDRPILGLFCAAMAIINIAVATHA